MGKNQHSKDRLFITASEWATLYGGKKKEAPGASAKYKKLPFDCCCLSLQPVEHPMCTRDGYVFDLVNIVPFIRKHGLHPVTGEKLALKDLIKLNFTKNADGKYHCPVTFKVFNEHTHISAIATTGNVYAHDAIKEFNIKAKNWNDLLTEEPFKRADIITLQDPMNPEKNNFANFYYIKKKLTYGKQKADDGRSTVRSGNTDTQAILDEVAKSDMVAANKKYSSVLSSDAAADPQDKEHTAHFSTGEVSRSFTATHLTVRTKNTAASIDDDVVRYKNIKDKAYVRLRTTFGDINIELHCDIVPKTCDNFLRHVRSGYYNNTIFHRNIRNFMIQGGDPTGTGQGGESAFGGKPFKDEFAPNLKHKGRGVVSMANKGPNTNGSQFFITYRSCPHLDRKHSVFGQVVGGFDVLLAMERAKVDDDNRPTEEIKIFDVKVFKDPFQDLDTQKQQEAAAKADEKKKEEKKKKETAAPKKYRSGVGKYIAPSGKRGASSSSSSSSSSSTLLSSSSVPSSKKSKPSGGFGNFSSW
ncbi:Ppil2 protein [Salpingoeca rosetta]|uniref:Ppil2 protein n=1 Tax=Salpingoeca rosetta (strain ATCC 50818 / BSB-021) TaxID=946362 RepID=F2UHV0_SALR5|nr:Ppil2 protein [Salpingoeca rosetta]EGD76699.1 Ppil2 protein [Salpingoeca rosetta]|eukprot:XP_004991071.1 Ppil2 protein [Salpingoeca rosetta]